MTWGGDVDAMMRLAGVLDAAAARITDALRLVGTAALDDGRACVAAGPTAMPVLVDMARWASESATDIRRRARILADPDGERRRILRERIEGSGYDPDPGFFGHVMRVRHAALGGLWDGVRGPVAGAAAMVATMKNSVVARTRAVEALADGDLDAAWGAFASDMNAQVGATAGLVGGIASGVRQTVVVSPGIQPMLFAERWHRDGFWRAAEDAGRDSGAAAPGIALSVVPGGEASAGVRGAVVSQVKSVSSAASALSGLGGVTSTWGVTEGDRQVLELAVPVKGAAEMVAYDYRNGDFLVAHPDGDTGALLVERHRWSRLEPRHRQALRDHGLVDGHGQPSR